MGTYSAPFSAPSLYLTIFFSSVTRRRHRLCFCARSPLNAAVGSCCIRILDWGSERRTRRRGRFGVGEGGGEGGVLGYGGLRRPLRVQAHADCDGSMLIATECHNTDDFFRRWIATEAAMEAAMEAAARMEAAVIVAAREAAVLMAARQPMKQR